MWWSMPVVRDVSADRFDFDVSGGEQTDGSFKFTLSVSDEKVVQDWTFGQVKEPLEKEDMRDWIPVIMELADRLRYEGVRGVLGSVGVGVKAQKRQIDVYGKTLLFAPSFYKVRVVKMVRTQAIVPFEEGVEERRPPVRPVKLPTLPTPMPTALGLGKDGMRRLRVLFESMLDGLGIKITSSLRVRSEEVIYQLESKYRFEPRTDAMEKAIIDFTKWIEENIYFKQ